MPNLNKIMLMGNLTRDPELRYTPKGSAVANAGIAVNRKYTLEGGETREEVTFIDWKAWNKAAEVIAQYCKKGDPIYLEGRVVMESWEDKQTGAKRSKLVVVVETFQFLGGKKDEDSSPRPARPGKEPAAEVATPIDDDDVPF